MAVGRSIVAGVLALVLASSLAAGQAWARNELAEETDPEVIRHRLSKLKAMYTDQHPDVRIMEKQLEVLERQRSERLRRLRGREREPDREAPGR